MVIVHLRDEVGGSEKSRLLYWLVNWFKHTSCYYHILHIRYVSYE